MAAVAAEAVDVILRDGRTLRLRRPRREGADSLLELFRFPNTQVASSFSTMLGGERAMRTEALRETFPTSA